MFVGEILGLDGESPLLEAASGRWDAWRRGDDRLAPINGLGGLRAFLETAGRAEADEALLALAELAATDGGDDVAAAAALAKALLPGASVLAARLTRRQRRTGAFSSASVPIDELVAAQLWIEVRTFPWRRLRAVGGNILVRTRIAVLAELGDPRQSVRQDPTWGRTVCIDQDMLDLLASSGSAAGFGGGGGVDSDELDPATELAQLLDWAERHGVITGEDRALVCCLVRESRHVELRSSNRGRGNLCSSQLAERVAPMVGYSPSTVRRRAARSVQALAEAVPSGLCA